MFDRDSLYNYIWGTLEKELGDTIKTDYLTDCICDAVSEWVPKCGDFWLNEDDGRLYVNKGWEDVLSNETYDDPFLATLTPEQREWRLKKIAASADDADYIEIIEDNETKHSTDS